MSDNPDALFSMGLCQARELNLVTGRHKMHKLCLLTLTTMAFFIDGAILDGIHRCFSRCSEKLIHYALSVLAITSVVLRSLTFHWVPF